MGQYDKINYLRLLKKDFAKEKWHRLEEFPHYSISNFGRVKRQYYSVRIRDTMVRSYHPRLLVPQETRNGMEFIFRKNGVRIRRSLSRLVANAFVSPLRLRNARISFRDGNIYNCRAENLKKDCRGKYFKLTPEETAEIKELLKKDDLPRGTYTYLGNKYGVNKSRIVHMRNEMVESGEIEVE